MNIIRKIAPVLLLSVFSLTQLHAILPHVHHDHHSTGEIVEFEHHHNDSHDSHDENFVHDSNDHDSSSEFIAHFFDAHSHQDVPHQHIVLTDELKVQSKTKSDFTQVDFSYKVTVPEKERKPIVKRFSNIYYPIPYLSSLSLRGPPSLV